MNFTPKMESFCTFFFTPFLELNLLLENNSAFSFPSPFSVLLVGGALARERPRRLRETKRAMGTRLTCIQNWTRNFCALFVKLNVDNQYICPTHPTHEALRKPCGLSAQTFHLHYVLLPISWCAFEVSYG